MGVEEDIIPTMALGSGSKKQGKKTNKKFIHLKFIGMPNKEHQLSQKLDPLIKLITFYNNIDKERNQQLSICSIKT